jgi:hypothetical protein
MVEKLIVQKQPRSKPYVPQKINFPSFDNLHLELIENKKKIKSGLPLIPLTKPVTTPKPVEQKQPTETKSKSPEKNESSDDDDDEEMIDDDEHDVSDKVSDKSDDESVDDEKSTSSSSKLSSDESDEDFDDDDIEQELGDKPAEEKKSAETKSEPTPTPVTEDPDDPYAHLPPEEREAKEKEEYIWKFRLLKRKYKNPDVPIPEFNEHSDLQLMKTTYDRTLRELMLDDNITTYRTYLVGGLMGMEFVCTMFLGVDLGGFAKQQIKMMNKYDRLLIELGEKQYMNWGSGLPVEVRLLLMILLQAGLFFVGKTVLGQMGDDISYVYRAMTGQPMDTPSINDEEEEEQPKRQMRGPRIKPSDMTSAKVKASSSSNESFVKAKVKTQ